MRKRQPMVHTQSAVPGHMKSVPGDLLNTFFRSNCSKEDIFRIDPTTDQWLTDRLGQHWHIPAGSICDLRGNTPDGYVQLGITVVNDPREALLAGWAMSSSDLPLHTHTFFRLRLGIHPHALRLIKPIHFSATFPTLNRSAILRVANKAHIGSDPEQELLVWKQINSRTGFSRFGRRKDIRLAVPGPGTYTLSQPYMDKSTRAMLTIRAFGPSSPPDDVQAFLLIDPSHPPLQLHATWQQSFTAFNLPAGKNAWALVIGQQAEQLLYGLHRLAPLSNRVESVELRKTAAEPLAEKIRNILL